MNNKPAPRVDRMGYPSRKQQSEPMKNFRPEISYKVQSDDHLKLDQLYQEKAHFIHNSCKEYLNGILSSIERLQQKAYAILAFSFAFMSFSLFRIIDLAKYLNNPEQHILSTKIIEALFIIIMEYLIISIIMIFSVIYPKKKHIAGNDPINLISQENIDRALTQLLMDESSTYQDKIDINLSTNKRMSKIIKTATASLFILPVITFIIIFSLSF